MQLHNPRHNANPLHACFQQPRSLWAFWCSNSTQWFLIGNRYALLLKPNASFKNKVAAPVKVPLCFTLRDEILTNLRVLTSFLFGVSLWMCSYHRSGPESRWVEMSASSQTVNTSTPPHPECICVACSRVQAKGTLTSPPPQHPNPGSFSQALASPSIQKKNSEQKLLSIPKSVQAYIGIYFYDSNI